ncbi:MAG TPA: signal peptidase I, partial [Longimicrobiales bacterium]|nr:signal peptidase I [Longimicrobiales bacterium]
NDSKKTENNGAKTKSPESRGGFIEWLKSIAWSLAIFLVLRTFVIQTWVITSGSMEPTLLVGDMLMLNKVAYGATVPGTHKRLPGYTTPHRHDIIVFRSPVDTLDLIKRLIGMPGDTLLMKDGNLFLNGKQQVEHYAHHSTPMPYDVNNWGPIVVPAQRYFVMGDNRDNSLDSRFWGFLDPARVKGKAFVIYYSYERDSGKAFPFLHARLNRIGHPIR